MRPLRFTLQASLKYELNISSLTPDNLKGKSKKQIAAMKLKLGRSTVTVASLFSISGSDSQKIVFSNCENKLIRIGENMTQGSIEISGNAGDYLGQNMKGGYIEVKGNCENFAGAGMTGGKIEVHGDTGDFLGAATVGNITGMNEGTIIVHGNAGSRIGDRMRRGMIVVFGNSGEYCASNMLAGTIIILGKTGAYLGFNMKRGTLVLGKKPIHLMATFRDCGLLKIEFLRLLFKQLALSCEQFKVFSDFGPEALRFAGDTSTDGMGEILILKNARNRR